MSQPPANAALPAIPEATISRVGHPALPKFEGVPVDSAEITISGLTKLSGTTTPVIGVDDRVRLVGEFKCVGVRHQVDKQGNLVRTQVLTAIDVEPCAWDPSDPTDDGVLRAR